MVSFKGGFEIKSMYVSGEIDFEPGCKFSARKNALQGGSKSVSPLAYRDSFSNPILQHANLDMAYSSFKGLNRIEREYYRRLDLINYMKYDYH
jgi:hypothetical protein